MNMDFLTSLYVVSDVNNIQQRRFIYKLCSQILSIPFAQVNSHFLENNDYRNNDINRLLKKNYLIKNINEIVPGFKYFVDFQWEFNEFNEGNNVAYDNNRIGDLIFGSDYGIYLVIETCWLIDVFKMVETDVNHATQKTHNKN